MKTIYKYPVINKIKLPKNANILYFGSDPHNEICFWAEVDTKEQEEETYYIEVIGTGWPIDNILEENFKYQTTIKDDIYMWHIYMKKKGE